PRNDRHDQRPNARHSEQPRNLGDDNGDVDIVLILKRRHTDQLARVRAIDAEIAAKEKLREKVAYDITRLETMLASIAVSGARNGASPDRTARKHRKVNGTRKRSAKVREGSAGSSGTVQIERIGDVPAALRTDEHDDDIDDSLSRLSAGF